MKPEDMCLVDFEGNQLGGDEEAHERNPDAPADHEAPAAGGGHGALSSALRHGVRRGGRRAAHVHDPGDRGLLGTVPIAPYRTPGTPEMGKLVADLSDKHNTILMANHGVVSWSHNNVEDAYFKMEIIEAYCRTVWWRRNWASR